MLHNAMYNGIVMLWPPIQMLIWLVTQGQECVTNPQEHLRGKLVML